MLLRDTWAWLTDPASWEGPNGLLELTLEHLAVAALSTAIAVVVALPGALWLGHRHRGKFLVAAFVNVGRAVPSFGIIVVAAVLFIRAGLPADFWPLVIALVLLALPPIFTSAHTAVGEVDPALVEAARGMGLGGGQVLRRVELPLALPLVMNGIRIAFAQVIATVALGAVVSSGGGLGQPIIVGFATLRTGGDVLLLGGAILVALLTLVADRLFALLQRLATPAGVRRLSTPRVDRRAA
jgi:osmoprotectant transport system permease protein